MSIEHKTGCLQQNFSLIIEAGGGRPCGHVRPGTCRSSGTPACVDNIGGLLSDQKASRHIFLPFCDFLAWLKNDGRFQVVYFWCRQTAARMREWHDKQVASHIAFVPAILIALFYRRPPFVEPLFFVLPLLVLSTLYHRYHEPEGTLLARVERVAAYALFTYGCLQLFFSTTPVGLVVCGLCCAATSLTHVLSILGRLDWDRWHYVGMHLVPGVWAAVVGLQNEALI